MKRIIYIYISVFLIGFVALMMVQSSLASIKSGALQRSASTPMAPSLSPSKAAVKKNIPPFSFTRTLKLGSTGEDVRQLQIFLNSNPATVIATKGAGSPGHETTYFGLATKKAVIKFQNIYKKEILTPTGLKAGSGIVNPRTRSKLNAFLTARRNAGLLPTSQLSTTPNPLVPSTPTSTRTIATTTLTALSTYTPSWGGGGGGGGGGSASVTNYTLTINASNGSVDKAVSGQSTTNTSFSNGTQVTLTATPAQGYQFTGWSGDVTDTANPLTVSMNANKNITATFSVLVTSANSPMGINFNDLAYYTPDIPFKNVLKQGMGWHKIRLSDASDSIYDGPVDANGYPTSVPDGYELSVGMLQSASHYPGGQYVVLFDGAGTLGLGGWDGTNMQVDPQNPNRYTFDVTPGDAGIRLIIYTMTSPITNIRVMPIAYESTEASNPWHPTFLANLANFRVIRFIGWSDMYGTNVLTGTSQGADTNTITLDASASTTNNAYTGMLILVDSTFDRRLITAYNGTTKVATVNTAWTSPPTNSTYTIKNFDLKEWTDRVTQTDMIQGSGKGVAVEYMVDLANRLNASPWFIMPTDASDDFIQQFATYVKNNLNSNLKIYLEYTNEEWNTGTMAYDYSIAKSNEMGIGGWQYYAYRATQIFKIWDDVFNESHLRSDRTSSRIVRVLSSQNASPGSGTTIMDYDGSGINTAYFTAHPTDVNPFSGSHKAADYADTLAVTYYIGETIDAGTVAADSADQLITLMENEVMPSLTPTQMSQVRSGSLVLDIPDIVKSRIINIQNARDRGLDTVIYEGGLGLITNDQTKMDAINRSSRVPELYSLILNSWKNIGLDSNNKGPKLFNAFDYIHKYGSWGDWGHLEYYNESTSTTPKWLGLTNFISSTPAWWTDLPVSP